MAAGDLPVGFTLDQSAAAPDVAPPALPPGVQLDPPQAPGSRPLPANAGLAKFGSSVLGLPVDTIENAINLTRAAQGTVAGALGATDWMPPLLEGSPGGSRWLQDKLRATGQPGLSPDNPTPQSALGTAQYDFVSRGGFIPGGAIPAAGSMVAEKIGGPAWAPVGAMLPSAATMAYNELRAPSLAKQEAQNQVRDATLKDARDAGLKVIPSSVQTNPVLNAAESLGGKAAIKQQLQLDNLQTVTAMARKDIGLAENAPITMQALEGRRKVISQPYAEVAAISPSAGYFLRELRDARQKATQFWKEYETQKTVSSLENFKALEAKAKAMEQRLEVEAVKVGKPDLVPQMRQARQDLAKTWDVERALNLGDGTVDAQVLGRLYDHGAKLSGGLETIAKFATSTPGRQVTGAPSGTPGVSKMNWAASGLLGTGGLAALGPLGAAVGATAPFVAPPAARSVLLSDIYQRNFARPNYDPAMLPEGSLQSLARTAFMENERARK